MHSAPYVNPILSPSRPSPLSSSLHRASTCTKALTAQGRGRCFLRSALQCKVLAVAMQQLVQSPQLLEFYDSSGSILGNEELREPFLSLVLVLTEVDFSLDLQNCSFLDESWLLPVCVMYETVPCRALGMVVRYVDGRVIVTKVLPGSQAEVDEVVLAGDVLDEINGCSLRNAYSGQAGAMLQKLKGQPLSLRVLRWQGHNGEVYEPLLPYLEAVKEKEPHFQLQCGPRRCDKGQKRRVQGGRLLYNLQYLGRIGVGMVRRWAEMGCFLLLSSFFHACVLFLPAVPVWRQRGAAESHSERLSTPGERWAAACVQLENCGEAEPGAGGVLGLGWLLEPPGGSHEIGKGGRAQPWAGAWGHVGRAWSQPTGDHLLLSPSWCLESRNTATVLLFHGSTVLEDPWRNGGPCIFFFLIFFFPSCFSSLFSFLLTPHLKHNEVTLLICSQSPLSISGTPATGSSM
uniref:PDZ domain-containing protein n=1 Tax=Chrysolophus pictus TaxID=9089 RepID=A0A8C3L758_CHRPC